MSCDRSTYPSYAASNEDVILQQVRGNKTIDNTNEAHIPKGKGPRVDSGGAAQGQIGQLAGLGLQEHQQQQQQQSQSNEVRWLLMAARASSVGQASWSALQGGAGFPYLGMGESSAPSLGLQPHVNGQTAAPRNEAIRSLVLQRLLQQQHRGGMLSASTHHSSNDSSQIHRRHVFTGGQDLPQSSNQVLVERLMGRQQAGGQIPSPSQLLGLLMHVPPSSRTHPARNQNLSFLDTRTMSPNLLLRFQQGQQGHPAVRAQRERPNQIGISSITFTKRGPNGLPIDLPAILALPDDHVRLSSRQMFLRHQIEAFRATKADISTHTRGRNKPVTIGQIGIRCRHCAHLHVGRRQKGSTYFPAVVNGLYQAAQNMSTTHMQCGLCSEMPNDLKQQFSHLISTKAASSGAGRPYWARAATKLGLVDDADNGIRFIRDQPLEKRDQDTPGSDLDSKQNRTG
jgi:hypothetical protein